MWIHKFLLTFALSSGHGRGAVAFARVVPGSRGDAAPDACPPRLLRQVRYPTGLHKKTLNPLGP